MPDPKLLADREALVSWMEQRLQDNFAPTRLDIEDQSYLHAGHSGHQGGGHFVVTMDAEKFVGLSRLQKHQLVHEALAQEIGHAIHALSLQLGTPK